MAAGAPFPHAYRPLSTSGEETRILDLILGDADSPIECSIRHVFLADGPEFYALSYVWGDPTDTISITVDGTDWPVNKNPFAALKRVQQDRKPILRENAPFPLDPSNPRRSLPIWADAICINQADLDEKSVQVGLRGAIYKAATRVVIYLGSKTDPLVDYSPLEYVDFTLAEGTVRQIDTGLNNLAWMYKCEGISFAGLQRGERAAEVFVQDPVLDALSILGLFAEDKHLHELPFYTLRLDSGPGATIIHLNDETYYLRINPTWTAAMSALVLMISQR